ncbi:S9 family peptidase [soil metagenome]
MRVSLLVALSFSVALTGAGCSHLSGGTQNVASETNVGTGGTPALIPRKVLFENPNRAGVQISNDGKHLSFLSSVGGVLNIWVAPIDHPDDAVAITHEAKRGVRTYFWAFNNTHIIYSIDKEGDENWRVYAVNVSTKEAKDLTPLNDVRAQIQEVSERFPNEILIGLNDRNKEYHDVYRVNILTGAKELVQKNDEFVNFITDDDFNIRFGTKYQPDGSIVYMQPQGDTWKEFFHVPEPDTMNTSIAGFDKSGKVAYLVDSRDRNTSALATLDLATGKETIIASDPLADLDGTMMDPRKKTIQAASFEYDRIHWTILDPSIKPDLDALAKVNDGELRVIDRTQADRDWIAAFIRDDGPVQYYHWNRDTQKARFLFTNRKALEGLTLARMNPEIVKARDGKNLVCYLTIPVGMKLNANGRPAAPLPMVLDVHGGPWARDSWGYDPSRQLLANRGYAVLSVNFRGSTGFGKDFVNAANKEWAGKMHEDLLDAVDWAVQEGIADKDKVAIMGGSYGGYATLVGLTFTPDVFAAGVDVVGPSNIITLLNSIPPYWAPAIQMFKTRVGDHTTEEGKKFLESRSPLTFADRITKPLLIAQGKNDPRVKQAEADQIVKAMQAKNIPVTYVLYPDEGHGFARPENNISFMAVTEAFLAEHLGGRFEPVGTAFEKSSITVPAGAEEVPGLKTAIEAKKD